MDRRMCTQDMPQVGLGLSGFLLPLGEFSSKPMDSGASRGADKLVSVNFTRLRGGWEALGTQESYSGKGVEGVQNQDK